MLTSIRFIIQIATLIFFGSAMLSPSCAETIFFADRAAWEAEVSNRGFLVGQQDFDVEDSRGAPIVSVRDVEVWFGVFKGVRDGKLVPWQGGNSISLGSTAPFAGDGSGFTGPIGGIGIDVDVSSSGERFMRVSDCPRIPGDFWLWEPWDPRDCLSEQQSYLGEGFVGVLFDPPRDPHQISFGVLSGQLQGADNFVVAVPLPEPAGLTMAMFSLVATLSCRRRGVCRNRPFAIVASNLHFPSPALS